MVVIPKLAPAFVLLAMVPAPPTKPTTSDDSPTTPLNVPKFPVLQQSNYFRPWMYEYQM